MENFIIPMGAEVEKSRMNAHWTNYMSVVNSYIKRDDDRFMWVSFDKQLQYAEKDIEKEICRVSPNGGGILFVHAMYYNRYVADCLRYMNTEEDEDIRRTERFMKEAREWLEPYTSELESQQKAAAMIQKMYKEKKQVAA